jgi:hypothetical protein
MKIQKAEIDIGIRRNNPFSRQIADSREYALDARIPGGAFGVGTCIDASLPD